MVLKSSVTKKGLGLLGTVRWTRFCSHDLQRVPLIYKASYTEFLFLASVEVSASILIGR